MSDAYSYAVTFSPEDGEWVGTCVEFPSLSHLDADREAALRGIAELVTFAAADMREAGETPPEPISLRRYSGRFVARVPAALHRALTLEAAAEGVSLNALVTAKLAAPLAGSATRPGRAKRRVA